MKSLVSKYFKMSKIYRYVLFSLLYKKLLFLYDSLYYIFTAKLLIERIGIGNWNPFLQVTPTSIQTI